LGTDVASACSLQFVTEPNNALVNTKITGNSYDSAGPPVTVQILDANGSPTTFSSPITLELGTDTAADTNPATALQGIVIRPTSGGLATFKNLHLPVSNNHYTLVASAWRITSAESSPFNIGDTATNCDVSQDCTVTVTGVDSTLTITAGPNGGQLNAQLDPGTPMDGPGSDPEQDPGCANYHPINLDWYGFDVSNLGDAPIPAKSITWTVRNVTPDGFQTCFGAVSPFIALNSDGRPSRSLVGRLPDGTSGFVGLLPFCDRIDSDVAEPCVSDDPLSTEPDPNSTTGEDVIVDVSIPAGFQGDPFMAR
jgi:hypothetical protein